MTGTISPYTGRVKNAHSVWLNDRPLQDDLGKRLQREVRIANDTISSLWRFEWCPRGCMVNGLLTINRERVVRKR
ncbi:Fructokinase [Vibrio spartinae]|uniref:Fructokinase n=1 Tax=Vibrio spartinae TaxID=1918945 RepID=A0ABX6R6P1_9VIBR|nr:Fructokinase [Vibrio spartinae]